MFIFVSVVLLSVFTFVIFLQVLSRNYFHWPLLWTNEVALACFMWTVFLGSAVAVRQKKHYVVEVFPRKFAALNLALDAIATVSIYVLIYVMIFHGYRFGKMGLKTFSTSIGISQAYFFFAIPVSGVGMLLFHLENTYHLVRTIAAYARKGGSV